MVLLRGAAELISSVPSQSGTLLSLKLSFWHK